MNIKSYLYYDANTGEIKAISPIPSEDFAQWACTKIPLPTATKFISGEWDTTRWFVASESTEEDGIVRDTQFDYVPVVTEELVAIPRAEVSQHISSAVTINVYTSIKTIEVTVAKIDVKLDLKNLPEAEMLFYVTKRNDPSVVYGEFTVPVEELFETGAITIPYEFDATDVSVYTRKLFRFYQLNVKRNKLSKRKLHTHLRVNTLVPYKEIKKRSEAEAESGIIVVHNVNKGTLEISMEGDVDDITSDLNNDTVPLFLTRPLDPTILIDNLYFNLSELVDGNVVVLPVPENAGDEFGVSGYPYIDNLFFMRT